jgi:hypothetical protein
MIEVKLSQTQLNILSQLKNGVVLYHITGLNSRWFLSARDRSIDYRTIYKLIDLGLVRETDELHPKGILTAKGRKYLCVGKKGEKLWLSRKIRSRRFSMS